ncbi:MAG: 4Fe-4S dicluster domain-containing protein [Candidatus Tectomicrobia bacterium]|uniref:4Fe-4S dicluster domain-containing protein n=1 Tax=Tectimicrobiota bacterium TaxID=2528274 RepID=A0A933GJZ8_UNCTE|nr:4Fe-4S dicluster domain-containing protein [Candidatus Tectomicrobia bacterium]
MKVKNVLFLNKKLCIGCQECELVCSLTKTGIFNPKLARIKVVFSEGGATYPIICRHCQKPACKEACPVDALSHNLETGAVVLDEKKCIGCRACVEACPFGAIQVGPNNEILKCDLCGGNPVCVQFCSKRPKNTVPKYPNPPGAKALNFLPPFQISTTCLKLGEEE